MRPTFTRTLTVLLAILMAGCTSTPINQASSLTTREPTLLAALPTLSMTDPTPTLLPAFNIQSCIDQSCQSDGHFILQNPIPADGNQQVTANYRFGSTLEGEREIHHGVEFNNPSGTPVLAAADGLVVFAGKDAQTNFGMNTYFYGNLVILEHHLPGIDPVLFTLYAHLSEVSVEAGEEVTAGQPVGKVGRTGSAQGSHLHFEVRLAENTYAAAVNPELWLTLTPGYKATRYGVLAGVFMGPDGKLVRITNIQLEYSRVENGTIEERFSLSTYYDGSLSSDPIYQENFVISELIPGWYRVTTIASGKYISHWILVESGKLTFLTIPLP